MDIMKNKKLWWTNLLPVFIFTFIAWPLIFILANRFFSFDFFKIGLMNGAIVTGGILLNLFVGYQLTGKIKKFALLSLSFGISLAVTFAVFVYLLITKPLFLLYGIEIALSYFAVVLVFSAALNFFADGFLFYQWLAGKKDEEIRLERDLRDKMEDKMHTSRLHPHFLFNSLNLLVSVLDDRNKSEEVLILISDLLRYNLDVVKKDRVSIDMELANAAKYLTLQKERFGARLDYNLVCSCKGTIPPLLIQPLVENSLKHNMKGSDPLKIDVTIEKGDNHFIIHVIDSARCLKPEMIGKGLGMELTKRRVEIAGGLFEVRNGGVYMRLPV